MSVRPSVGRYVVAVFSGIASGVMFGGCGSVLLAALWVPGFNPLFSPRVFATLMITASAIVGCAVFWCSLRFGWTGPKGLCAQCGYNLTGNVSGRCPECGSSFSSVEAP
jgi:hypothetical protein